jgi:hypothetical protein
MIIVSMIIMIAGDEMTMMMIQKMKIITQHINKGKKKKHRSTKIYWLKYGACRTLNWK